MTTAIATINTTAPITIGTMIVNKLLVGSLVGNVDDDIICCSFNVVVVVVNVIPDTKLIK